MSENKIYKLLNETKTNVAEYEEVEVTHFEKQRILYNLKKKNAPSKKYPIFILAAIVLIIFGSQPVVKGAVHSFLETIRYSFSEMFGNQEDTSHTVISVNQTAHINGAEIKVEDILYFDRQILISLLVDLEGSSEEEHFLGFSDFSLSLNGKTYTLASNTGSLIDEEKNIHSVLYTIPLDDSSLSEEITMDLQINDLVLYYFDSVQGNPPIEGTASFSWNTTLSEMTKYLEKYEMEHSVKTDDMEYQIHSLWTHPMISMINTTFLNESGDYQLIELRGMDDRGRTITFNTGNHQVTDDQWSMNFYFQEKYSDITAKELSEADSITLQFYSAGHPEGTGATYLPYGDPFTVHLR
ncbi:hypothetical protein [Jeotgalibaca caeni]|uniref:hypothetical protein n=1 Tax=Jeotgalibaca caeni TaxID=3028623 RepID=UPI00237E9F0F|nr:hypothetical protein [Jeotgalibaca caeni]MDE1547803.1 hypothetical protein [Jeotgalibaca caeni]